MADLHTAQRRPVLDGRHGGSSAVRLMPVAPASRVSLRAPAQSIAALSAALSLPLPSEPKTSSRMSDRWALWLGPDEWLLIDGEGADLMAALSATGALHAATDVSHRNMAILVSGPGAEATLSAACPQDLSLKAFPVGACSRTVFGKAEVVLLRVEDEVFRVEFWRSFAEYVFGLLEEASLDSAI
ncbi:sarcosine oxidase subunit gamma [Oryzifoliimicrobium ureilyticus]|uniref:sarcosine oxidase subunit gamma n=1 Tax=Oryzifoliimicrobium ureilyticus TaxID=3113724 RepID=UPI00307623EB